MDTKEEIPYELTSENIKIPSFHNAEFESLIRKPINNEIFTDDLNNLYSKQNELLTLYSNLIKSNRNGINENCLIYKKNSYDFLILIKAIKLLSSVIINKNTPSFKEDEDIDLETIFEDEEYKDIIKDQYKQEEEKKSIIDLISTITEHAKNIKKSNHKFGIDLMDISIKYLIAFIDLLKNQIEKFKAIDNFNNLNIDEETFFKNHIVLLDLIKNLEKLDTVDLLLNNGFYIDQNDINNIPEKSEEWDRIKKNYFRVVPKNEKEIIEIFHNLMSNNDKGQAILYHSFKSDSNVKNIFNAMINGIKYKFNDLKAIYESKKIQISKDRMWLLKVLNVTRTKFMKRVIEFNYPSIAFRKKLYLKREYPEITIDYISQLLDFIYKGETKKTNRKFELIPDKETPNELYFEQILKENKKYYVSTRLIHSSKITFTEERKHPKKMFYFFTSQPEENKTNDSIIIHLHGGGFIATTTFFHEKYLRKWSNELNIPIIGIDYGLSPENKYPKALNDCFQGYMWIINHMESMLDMKIKNVILSGDSAGGTLVLALNFLLIAINKYENLNIRLPDLILAEYPCCDTSIKNMSISMIISLQDPMLNDKLLKYSNECYRNNYENENDPFLNPSKANDLLINEMNRTRFFLGSFDPLRDDSIRLISKISKHENIDWKSYEFKDYGHGFFGLDSEILRKNPEIILFKEIREFLNERNK